MRASLRGRRCGINWGIRERLKDLDFADDLCLLAHTDLQDKLNALTWIVSRVGLCMFEISNILENRFLTLAVKLPDSPLFIKFLTRNEGSQK
jgi:hypothetical protein